MDLLFNICNLILILYSLVIAALYATLAFVWCENVIIHIFLIATYVISGLIWVALMVMGRIKNSVPLYKWASPILIPVNVYLLGILVVVNAETICGKEAANFPLRIVLSSMIVGMFLFNLGMRHWANMQRRELEYEGGLLSVPSHIEKVHESRPSPSMMAQTSSAVPSNGPS